MNAAPRSLLTVVLLAGVSLSACGGGGDESPEAAAAGPNLNEAPAVPEEADCNPEALQTSVKPEDLVPPPGVYQYETQGTRVLRGDGSNDRLELPRSTDRVVTEALAIENLRCFRIQRRFTDQIGDTATFVVRGGDLYMTQLGLVDEGDYVEVVPEPPIKVLDGSGALEWSGAFSGGTSGQYQASALGRRSFDVGGTSLRALGIELRASFTGDVTGTIHSIRWQDLDRNFAVSEDDDRVRELGLGRYVLNHDSRLLQEP